MSIMDQSVKDQLFNPTMPDNDELEFIKKTDPGGNGAYGIFYDGRTGEAMVIGPNNGAPIQEKMRRVLFSNQTGEIDSNLPGGGYLDQNNSDIFPEYRPIGYYGYHFMGVVGAMGGFNYLDPRNIPAGMVPYGAYGSYNISQYFNNGRMGLDHVNGVGYVGPASHGYPFLRYFNGFSPERSIDLYRAHQVMVEIPRCYTRVYVGKYGTSVMVSENPLPGFELDDAFNVGGIMRPYRYIGAYNSVLFSNGVYGGRIANPASDCVVSISEQLPLTGYDRADFRQMTRNTHPNFWQCDFWLMRLLFILYLTDDGIRHHEKPFHTKLHLDGLYFEKNEPWDFGRIQPNGLSNQFGNNTDSIKDTVNSFRGVENYIGSVWSWVDGINIFEARQYTSKDPWAFVDDTTEGHNLYSKSVSKYLFYSDEDYRKIGPEPQWVDGFKHGGTVLSTIYGSKWKATMDLPERWEICAVGEYYKYTGDDNKYANDWSGLAFVSGVLEGGVPDIFGSRVAA